MKKITDDLGRELTIYEDTQSGDTIGQHDTNTTREEKFEKLLDYFRDPEDRMYDDDPEEPEEVRKLRKLWEGQPIGSKAGKTSPENKEERRKKQKLFWETGKILAEFYDETGHSTIQCPQCGYYTLEKNKECGGTSRNYSGCGHEFDNKRNREYATESALERVVGELNDNQPLFAFMKDNGKGFIVASAKQSKAENVLARRKDVDSLEELGISEIKYADLDHFELVERNDRQEVVAKDHMELIDGSKPVKKENGKYKKITQYKYKQEYPKEPLVNGIHQWKSVKKFKQFYWMFPNGPMSEKPEDENKIGYYSEEVSWFFNYDFSSYFNARAWIMPLYWEMVEDEKGHGVKDSHYNRKERRKKIRNKIDEFKKKPRKNFLTNSEHRKYLEQ